MPRPPSRRRCRRGRRCRSRPPPLRRPSATPRWGSSSTKEAGPRRIFRGCSGASLSLR
jgi:hypothetical protein